MNATVLIELEGGRNDEDTCGRIGDRLWCFLVAIYLAADVSANTMAAKLFAVFGVQVTAGAVAISLVFIMMDMLNELYGRRAARQAVFMGIAANCTMLLLSRICLALPASPYGVSQQQFAAVFGSTFRVVLASMSAYFCSSLLDVTVFFRLRRATNQKHFWLRKNLGAAIGLLLDSSIFCSIAFAGIVPLVALPGMILSEYAVKWLAAPLSTPFSYLVIWLARRRK